GQYFTNDQIKEMTRKVSAEVDLVHQQTQNQRYGSSHIGATAKDISNVVTDAASGVVDIFHGIDKAVADTWNNRSEERFSRNAETDLVCRLLLETKLSEFTGLAMAALIARKLTAESAIKMVTIPVTKNIHHLISMRSAK